MSKPFLGVGTGFPLQVDTDTGSIVRAEYEESVRQSILIILGTAKGERVMRPDFGCGIHDLVFENLSSALAGRVQQTVNEALLRLGPPGYARVRAPAAATSSWFTSSMKFARPTTHSISCIRFTSTRVFRHERATDRLTKCGRAAH